MNDQEVIYDVKKYVATITLNRPKTLNAFTGDNIKEMEKNSLKIEREVRDIRKEVNKEVEFQKTLLKSLNVFGVPLLVGIVGLLLAMRRRALTAAA